MLDTSGDRRERAEISFAGQKTISALFRARVAQWGDRVAMRDKELGVWVYYNWNDYDRFARQIAAAIVRRRDTDPIVTSSQLVELLYDTIPQGARRTGGHPGKRVFQALRIEVNAELEAVENAVPGYLDLLRFGGRAVFMAYHSLEDKIVKRELATRTASRTPAGLPVELPGHGPEFEAVTRGAEKADQTEIDHNPRSASVRVRLPPVPRSGSDWPFLPWRWFLRLPPGMPIWPAIRLII